MALSDLELLQLVEQAKEKQKGPKGEPGVGIQSIEQFDGDSFTIKLTDGNFKKIDLPAGKDGEVGATGPAGERGPAGAAGSRGAAGSDGAAGADGQDGAPGVSVETGIVNAEGQLLIGFSDGSSVNLGNVRGPAGATGERGPTGLPGAAGADGAAVLSGPRTPQESDGQEGDHWIDISSAEFNFYKKSGTGWSMVASLRQPGKNPAVAVPVGSGSGGGGGKGEPQTTRTLPLINGGSTIRKKAQERDLPTVPGKMDTQEDANLYFLDALSRAGVSVAEAPPRPPHIEGQLWFCTAPDDLTLYIYDGAVWVPAAPPVSLDGIEGDVDYLKKEIWEAGTDIANAKIDISSLEFEQERFTKDQERQDGQIATLEEEISQIRTSTERGAWTWSNLSNPGTAEYTLIQDANQEELDRLNAELQECLISAGTDNIAASKCNRDYSDAEKQYKAGPTQSFQNARQIVFNPESADGETHTFADVPEGSLVDVFNDIDDGYMVAKVISKNCGPETAVFDVEVVEWRGQANGKARFKFFEMQAGDPTGFIRKGSISSDGTEEKINEYLYGTRLDFKGNSSFIRIKDKAWLAAYENTSMRAKISPLGLFNMADQPPAEDNHHKVWVPNITQMQERFAGTKKGKEVKLYVEYNILYAEWD